MRLLSHARQVCQELDTSGDRISDDLTWDAWELNWRTLNSEEVTLYYTGLVTFYCPRIL